MNVILIRKQLESETLYLPELKPFLGKNVEITIREAMPTDGSSPYEAFFALAGQDVVVPDAYKRLRSASMI
jgi:hypothetical protein